MIKSYLKIAIRNLSRNKLFSFINIAGMAISLGACLLISFFVWDERQYDRFHPDGDRTYRVYNIRNGIDGATNYYPIVPLPFASYMQKDFPEIESTLRVMDTYGEKLFEVGERKILESNGLYAEPSVFDMLTIRVIQGSNQLDQPNQIALSASLAAKYFDHGGLGEMIKIGEENYSVSAIFADPPSHFHLKVNYIISFASVTKFFLPARFDNWVNQQYFTYIKLKPGTNADLLEEKFLPFVKKYAYPTIEKEGFTYIPNLQNIADIHLHSSNFEWEIAQRGNAQTVNILFFTGILLLLITCLNFVNLSTARAVRRMKEVGVRKVVGAARQQLVIQFICESVMISLIGLIIALLMVELSIPSLNNFAEKELSLPFNAVFFAGLVGFSVLIGVLAGSYPAFYLSRFRPAFVLNKRSGSTETAWFRQGLVVLQFMFSFFLITGSMIVLSQSDLLRNKDLGFTKDHLVMIPLRSAQLNKQESTKAEFKNNPNILSNSICFGVPGDIIAGDGVIEPITGKNIPVNLFCIDFDYIKTLGMQIIAGRDFSTQFPSDPQRGFIINETALKTLGYSSPEDAIGKPIHWQVWGSDSLKKGEVIGVVRDFHFKSLRDQLTPAVLHIAPDYAWKLVSRVSGDNLTETMAFLKTTYERLDPEFPFTYKFVDENFDSMYRSEEKLSSLFTITTALAILIACFGLFGLVEYSVNQRSKEVSIRKVFGASVRSLFMLLTGRYFLLIAIAFVVVIPVNYYAAQKWLTNFAYHIDISPWIYIKACALIVFITILTVSYQSLKAAFANPSQSLRNE